MMVIRGVLLLALLGALAIVPAAADPAVGGAAKGLPVTRFSVTGTPDGLEKPLRGGLALVGRPRWLWPDERAPYFPETLEADVRRARLFLARHGYPAATIDPEVRITDGGNAAHVTLTVTAGPPMLVLAMPMPGLPDEVDPPKLPLAPGDVFRDPLAHDSADRLRREVRNAGYAFATVTPRAESVDSTGVDVTLETTPGERFVLEEVRVKGSPPDLEALVRSTVPIRPGEVVRADALRETEEGLRDLDLFRTIQVDLERVGDGRLAIVNSVNPRPPRSFSTSLGYFSDEQLRGSAEWRHRNLFHGGRGFRIATRASRFLQFGRTEVIWPRIVGTGLRGVLGASIRRENEETYEALDQRVDFTVSRRFGRVSRASLGIALSHVNIDGRVDDPEEDSDPVGFLTTVPVSWITDTSDDPLNPTRGWLFRAQAEATPPDLGSVEHYARAEGQISRYQPLPFALVFASRALYGIAQPFQDSESVLASRRLYAGGSRSMRGYGRRKLGPRDAEGEPLGGEAKVEASVELRFPILGRLEGAAFLDGAQVWRHPANLRLTGLEWAAGPALMMRTPVGPIRVDWGFLLEPVDGEPDYVVHFSVGHPY